MTLKPFWATPAVRPSSSDHGSLPKERGKGETGLGGVQWGRVVGSKHRARLCSQGLLEDQAVGPAVAKRSTELSVLVLLLNRIISVLRMGPREEWQCMDGGRSTSGTKSQARLWS